MVIPPEAHSLDDEYGEGDVDDQASSGYHQSRSHIDFNPAAWE